MRIYYSPYYIGSYYLDLKKHKDDLLGLKVCGSMELLSELELRAGIVAPDLSESERLIAFHEALSKNIEGSIFEESFKTDEIGVARQLMAWSDSLLMEGWNPDVNVESDKLKALAKIVKAVVGKHISQRWKDITSYLEKHTIFNKNDIIEVHTEEIIPKVIKAALEQLSKQATVSYFKPEGEMPKDFSVYQFKNKIEAYRWYLSQPDAVKNVNVTISSDNCILNDMAVAMGKPVVDSKSQNSNPQLLQLFKLGTSLFARPLNVYNLLSYLQVPGNPLGGLSYKLADVLANIGGINEDWQKTIDEYDFTDEKGKDKREEKLVFIEMIRKNYQSDKILITDIKTYLEKLAHWCDRSIRGNSIDDERKEQLVVLGSFCRSLHAILPDDGYISSEELKTHVDGIYRPQSFTHMKAQKDSPDVIADITQLVDHAGKVCWLGCIGGSIPVYPYDFLNTSECNMLEEVGITIPTKSAFYTLHHQMMTDALKNVGQLILITWEFDGNARQEEHPLVAELKHQYGKDWEEHVHSKEIPNLPHEDGKIVNLEPQTSYLLSEMLAELKRETESYSSISTLIQHPFDYTMDYLLRLREPQAGKLADLDTTKGLVAHLFVKMLVDKYGEEMPVEYQKLDNDTKEMQIDDAIRQTGAILLLPEYKLVCQQFKAVLKQSVSVLTDIIQKLRLRPVDCEVEVNVNLKTIGAFYGSIDMVLKNEVNQLAIFDFKWSESKSFQTKLEENKAMQLELYREAAQQHYGLKVAGVAYYLFPKMTLFTTDFPAIDHVWKVKVKTGDDNKATLFDEVQYSYAYRRDELNQGFVEDSELEEIEKLNYTTSGTPDKPHYPLDVAYKTKGLKGCPYVKTEKPPFAKKKVDWKTSKDPKETKTTHPVLKGRLL